MPFNDENRLNADRRSTDTATARQATKFTLLTIMCALLIMLITVAWSAAHSSECTDAATLICQSPERYIMTIAPAALLMFGGIGAFVRTYQVWRSGGRWQIWQGAGWMLFVCMIAYAGLTSQILLNG